MGQDRKVFWFELKYLYNNISLIILIMDICLKDFYSEICI